MNIIDISMSRDDLTVIRASARRVAEIAETQVGHQTRRDLQVEAAAIIALIDNKIGKDQ